MRYAETGFNLEIDLSRGNIERVETDPGLTELHLGGLGTNTKILWDRVPPEVEPFSSDNPLIFGTGLLVGTPAPGANRTIVSSISPQTLLMAYSMIGGFWAPELKQAGYDKVVIRGKSPEWVYLWINNDKVEIRDASHLKGKGTFETMDLVREELKEPQAQVASIGLAGENRVYFASIEAGKGSAGRLGLGAIMGDKKLKAIAVRGTKDINIARPAEFIGLCNEVMKFIQHRLNNPINIEPIMFSTLGSPNLNLIYAWHTINFAWGNARRRRKDFWNKEIDEQWKKVMQKEVKRFIGCYNCPLECGAIIEPPGSPSFLLKCWSKFGYLMAAYANEDLDFSFRIAGRALSYGVDAFTCPQVIAFTLELYEAGILTDHELGGMPSETKERFHWLLDIIVRREGIGDVLANGVYRAARQIGKGAEAYDHNTVKKHEQVPIKLGTLNPLYYLMLSTGEKSSITQIEGQIPQHYLPKEWREEFVKDWIQVPTGKEEKFKKFILEWGDGDNKHPLYPSIELTCELVEWLETMHYIDDSTGICAGLSSFMYKTPYHIHNLPLFISYATGIDIDEDELWQIARRNRNLVRVVNIRRGLRKKDERPPEDHWEKRFPEYEAKLLNEYYKFKGWNKQGIPTKETLQKLGFDYVYEDFKSRGILKEE
jgi:aldehyde:ferredoxin oxidoreductase